MKRTISFVLAIVCAMLLCLTIPSGVGFAQYNDAKYDSYKNMGASNEDTSFLTFTVRTRRIPT